MKNTAIVMGWAMALSVCGASAQFGERTVIDNVRGGYYTGAYDGDNELLGCFISTGNRRFRDLDPDAVNRGHTTFQHYDSEDSHAGGWPDFG